MKMSENLDKKYILCLFEKLLFNNYKKSHSNFCILIRVGLCDLLFKDKDNFWQKNKFENCSAACVKIKRSI